jgi:hypothetical protein
VRSGTAGWIGVAGKPHAISHDVLAAGALPGRGAPAGATSEPEVSRRRDSNPEPPDDKTGAIRLIRAPTSNSGYTAVPSGCLKPHGLTRFRVTNDVTPDRTAQGQH